MAARDPHVVLGASGGTGSAVVEELVARGLPVRAVNRKGDALVPAGVERVAADVATTEGARLAVEGAAVVYHCAQPEYTRWAEEFPAMNRTVLDTTAAAGAKLVFADNLYMYDSNLGPISESTPETATTVKGRLRGRMADDLLAAHRAGTLRVAIGRSSDYYGPNGTDTTLGDRLFAAILAGKKAQWMGSLDQPHTCSYLPDMARALVTLGEHEQADGRAWVLPAAEPITGRAFIQARGPGSRNHPEGGHDLARDDAGAGPVRAVPPLLCRDDGPVDGTVHGRRERVPDGLRATSGDAARPGAGRHRGMVRGQGGRGAGVLTPTP